MKKLLAIVLAVSMLITAAISVSAANIASVTDNNSASADVKVAFVNDETGSEVVSAGTVYSVDIDFKDLTFKWEVNQTSTSENAIKWDPSTHTYVENKDEGTTVSYTEPAAITEAIKVANHSNAKVTVAAAFADGEKSAIMNGVTTALDNADKTLESAAVVAYNDKTATPTTAYTLTPSGTPDSDPTQGFTVGEITVTISAAN